MITKATLENFGPIKKFDSGSFGRINLFIGHNGKGKTTLLKTLYATKKSIEQNGRGRNSTRGINELLAEKLVNTFDVDSLGKLVSARSGNKASVSLNSGDHHFEYTFTNAAVKQILSANIRNTYPKTSSNSIFLPAKEILSLQKVILASRERAEFGFDDTYFDLAKALTPTWKGKNIKAFADSRRTLSEVIKGKIEYDQASGEWLFRGNDKQTYDISITSEGVKKLSILDSLLGNHYLSKESVVFIDEPESALHPEMISKFMDIIFLLVKVGLQFFIASHSYYVIKKLYLIAHQNNLTIPVYSFDEECARCDLKKEMPENPIIRESIRLYEEEIAL